MLSSFHFTAFLFPSIFLHSREKLYGLRVPDKHRFCLYIYLENYISVSIISTKMQKFYFLLIILSTTFILPQFSAGQSVLNPNDPVITYNANTPPTQPTFGQIGKWVRTVRLGWNTDSYKCYIYKGCAFRLKFPKSYNPTAVDGKKYPMLVFFHGLGETGSIYDNEYQLYHGGQNFSDAVDNGTFDGYIICMQSQGFWGGSQYTYMTEIINYMVANNKLDPFRVSDNGLSAGGQATWEMLMNYPTFIASALPMSAASIGYKDPSVVNTVKFTPMWMFQGGLDGSPAPSTSQQVRDAMLAAGGNYKYTEYPDLGHGTWDRAWSEPDFYPFLLRAYSSNPWTLFGRTEFCSLSEINVTLGLAPGFTAYQWKKDSDPTVIATSQTLNVTQPGTYYARVQRGSIWSDWSPTPVVIKIKAPTVSPTIQVSGLASKVVPALDGSTSVKLEVPDGYATYVWQKVGGTDVLSTTRYLTATPGDYKVKVTEQYGCSSDFSTPFSVIDANGPNKPDAANNLSVVTLSKTSLQLNWNDNPTPVYNETNFEIYQSTQAGGNYKLVAITNADILTYTVTGLNSNSKYFYKVRAVNNSGAAAASNEASGTTTTDSQPPTAPSNLTITGSTRSTISLSWTASTDDVGVTKYEIYVNGVKSFISTQTSFTVNNLVYGKDYNFVVKAKDFANNTSPASNQVTGQALLKGLNYKYYTFVGTWNNLPDFNTLTPVTTGSMPNIAITPRTQDDNFSFLWEGYIIVPVTGTYSFRTNSDDGSKLYLGSLNGTGSPYSFTATAIVNNDGLHAPQDATSANLTLTAGIYPIAATFYEQGGGESMTVSWKTPQSGTSYITIPNSAFADAPVVNGTAPADPSGLIATTKSFKRIDLNWVDNSSNETGFEIWRSTNATTGFNVVGVAAANATTYVDSTLSASTLYYYQIRAIGQYGQSNLVANYNFTEANWQFNNNYNDASPNGRTLTATATPTFDASDKKEGTHAVKLNGTSQYMTMPTTGSFLQTSYTQKSITFWMKSANNTSNRIIADIGGADNGLALRLDASKLYAGAASNNIRPNFSVAYTSTSWNYIALVYSGNTLKLYVNGTLSASNTSLGFTSIGTTTNGSRIGTNNGTNAFNTGTGFFSGSLDNFAIYNKALSAAEITSLMNNTALGQSFATTSPLPAVSAAPTNLLASGVSATVNTITWTDNATTETKQELYRSANNNSNYLLFATLPANTTSYSDTGLFANAVYYYKIRSVNDGGNSNFSNEDSAKTSNYLPVITKLTDRSVRYGVTTVIQLSATDADGDAISFAPQNFPAFASLVDNGNKTATITLNPASTDQQVYNLGVIATDTHGGSDITTFNLTVNDNYDPTIDSIVDYTVNEGDNLNINLTAQDQNVSDVLTWSVSGLPNAFSLTQGSNGTATLSLTPGYAAAGVYTATASVTDGKGGSATRQFKLTVNNKDPKTIVYVRFKDQDAMGAPWNSVTGTTTTNLKDASGNTTNIGLALQTSWWAAWHEGPQTGNNSGVYPDPVLLDYYYFGIFGGPETVSAKVTGLDVSKTYSLTFYAGSAWVGAADNGTTTYTVGAQTVSLYVQNNTQNTVSINGITPAADGTITFTMAKAAGTPVGYLNALVISSAYDDGTAPVAPKALIAQNVSGQGVQLNWQDVAYNETAYEIYRSATAAGPFAKIGQTQSDATSYVDATVTGATQYYYEIRAINSYGASNYSNIVGIGTLNRIPQINAIASVVVKNNQSTTINVTATDDATDHLTLTATNLPSFATFTDNGNGTGVININPTANSIGFYQGVTITAKDNSDSARSTAFDISVVDKDVSSVYLNFSDGSVGPKPWNNLSGWPFANTTFSNMIDDSNLPTGINVTLVSGFEGVVASGMRPGNGTGVYPEVVMRTGEYESSTATRTVKISGLSTAKKYNFVFFNSHDDGLKCLTNFTINGTTVSLDATYNVNKTVQINGISPDASGNVTISIAKANGSDYAFLSTLVIQSYASSLTLLNPTDLRVTDIKRNTVSLQWADRASAETGYEVWRATQSNGSYTLLKSLGAGVTSYTDAGLTQNTTYYYTVRAKGATAYSAYSNVVTATTYGYSIYVNFTSTNNAPMPWNNLDAIPQQGYSWSNFTDETGAPSSTGMQVTNTWAGMYSAGVTTGNNSGIFPDNVMIDSYGLFPGQTGTLKVTGLNLSMKYDFTFFASSLAYGDVNVAYTINGKTVLLNTSLNSKGLVTVYGVTADENGEVNITVAPGTTTSQFGLIGALIIQGFNAPTGSAPLAPSILKAAPAPESAIAKMDDSKKLSAYPNPFLNNFTLSVSASNKENVKVEIYNLNGGLVYQNRFVNLIQGENNLNIQPNTALTSGVYIVKVSYQNDNTTKVVKIIKQ